MTNGDRIRAMSDPELSEFMRQCERQEVNYYQHKCNECMMRPCNECRLQWLATDPDEYKQDPILFEMILKTVNLLFPGESTYQRATLASEVYKRVRNDL